MVSTFCPSLAVSEIAKLVVKTFQRCSQYECWYICAYSAEKKRKPQRVHAVITKH